MPHPERSVFWWQWAWVGDDDVDLKAESPWMKLFKNAYEWCQQTAV